MYYFHLGLIIGEKNEKQKDQYEKGIYGEDIYGEHSRK